MKNEKWAEKMKTGMSMNISNARYSGGFCVRGLFKILLGAAIVTSGVVSPLSLTAAETLQQEFAKPPASFKPWVFYFFENEIMDHPGITADLEALSAAGVGGMIVFSEHREGMKTGNVKMFSKEYDAGIQYLLREAKRLGLVVSLQDCAGSATAGGPWNSVEQSMKQFVWSETGVTGGSEQTLKLPQPFSVEGFYRDIAVMAYPVKLPQRLPGNLPKISASKGTGNPGEMMDGDILTSTLFRGNSTKQKREVLLEYAEPVTVGRLLVHGLLFTFAQPLNYELQASEDGKTWRKIAESTQEGNNPAIVDFPSVTGRYFKVLASTKAENFWIAELDLLPPGGSPRSYAQFNDWATSTGRDKGSFGAFRPLLLGEDKPLDPSRAIDLTSQLKPDGSLTWNVPPGDWLVMRMGYTTSGKKNHPATAEGLGFEVDKMDAGLVKRHAEAALQHMSGGGVGTTGLKMFSVDSWEAGGQNWTEKLAAEFEQRNGYSLMTFLPVLGGKLVGDAGTTQRFLEDFRHTLQALVSESFYKTMAEVARSNGLNFLAESSAAPIPIHRPMDYFPYVDIPAGEAWALGDFSPNGNISGGLRDAVSAAHLLGRPMTPVEVFTCNRGNWSMSPRFFKAFGDKILAAGGNQLTLHCTIHQPSGDIAPGWTMNHYGSTFNRHVTWWKDTAPWLDSIARSQVLLRQGRTVADFCRMLGDDEAIVPCDDRANAFWNAPAGYANDWITKSYLLNQLGVENGEIVSSSGSARYWLLVLPESDRMSLETVKKLSELVNAGGVVLGSKPAAREGRQGGEAADKEFARYVGELWGDELRQDRTVGKGRVLTGMTVDEALAAIHVKPDVTWTTASTSPKIYWHHRRSDQRDIYFLVNGNGETLKATFSFRIEDRAPEIWNPETGGIRKTALFREADGRVELPVELAPYESLFVVFDKGASWPHFESVSRDGETLWPLGTGPAAGIPGVWSQSDGKIVMEALLPGEYVLGNPSKETLKVKVEPLPKPLELAGPWKVTFEGVAKPAPQVFERLIPWNTHSDPVVRFFSGTGEYRMEFTVPDADMGKDVGAWLSLGDVRELAEVSLNGKSLGIEWTAPLRVEVTKELRSGKNEIVIRAVNTWANRLIGDAALPEDKRSTWSSFTHYKKDDKVPDSGLLGPVRIEFARRLTVNGKGTN